MACLVLRLLPQYIDSTYGNIEVYLDHIGFGSEWQQKLRHSFAPEVPAINAVPLAATLSTVLL